MPRAFGVSVAIAIAGLAVTDCGSETPTSPSSLPVLGSWQNIGPTPGLTRVVIHSQLGRVAVHEYGSCLPVDCDIGERSVGLADVADGAFSIVWNASFKISTQKFVIDGQGLLEISRHEHFTDGSGRADYDALDIFSKAK